MSGVRMEVVEDGVAGEGGIEARRSNMIVLEDVGRSSMGSKGG
jgi:hypothetical protein